MSLLAKLKFKRHKNENPPTTKGAAQENKRDDVGLFTFEAVPRQSEEQFNVELGTLAAFFTT